MSTTNSDQPKEGDLIFVRANTLLSRLIRLVGGSDWSHVAVYIKHGMIIEADWSGVIISSLKRYKQGSGYEYEVVKTNLGDKRYAFINALFKLVGDEYDFGLFFGNLLYRIFGHAKKTLGMSDNSGKFICVELASQGLIDAGVDLGKPANEIGLDYLYKFFTEGKK